MQMSLSEKNQISMGGEKLWCNCRSLWVPGHACAGAAVAPAGPAHNRSAGSDWGITDGY